MGVEVACSRIERLTTEQKVVGSILGAGPLLGVLKWMRNKGTAFALQMARPSRGLDDHVKRRQASPAGDVKNSGLNYYLSAKYIDTQIKCIW